MSFGVYTPQGVWLHYADRVTFKDIQDLTPDKAWAYVTRLAARVSRPAHTSSDYTLSNNLGDNEAKSFRTTNTYCPEAESIVTKYYDVFEAVVIGPGSWVDMHIQNAYNHKNDKRLGEKNE